MELALRSEIEAELWTTWGHSIELKIVSSETIRAMVKTLIAEYWRSYNRGDMQTMDGMTRLLRIFVKINDLITYRLLTEPKLSCRLFTPHILNQYHKRWNHQSRMVGLPPNNYGD